MSTSLLSVLASATCQTHSVPDMGATATLLGIGVVTIGAVSRFMKNRKR